MEIQIDSRIGSDRVPEELWMELHNSVQELYTMYYMYKTAYITAVTKIIPKEKKMQEGKWLSEETWKTAEKRR